VVVVEVADVALGGGGGAAAVRRAWCWRLLRGQVERGKFQLVDLPLEHAVDFHRYVAAQVEIDSNI